MKILKWFVGIVVGVVLLGVVALGILTLALDTDVIKEQVIVKFEQRTGHTLQINAPIEWSVFPWLGLKLEKVVVGNAPGFGDEPLAAIDVLDVKVGLMPLLEKRIAVDTVTLKGVDINLMRNKAGKTNWESLAGGKPAGGESEAAETPGQQEAATGEFQIDLKGIELDDLDLDYVDAQKGAAYHLEDLDVRIGELKRDTPVLVELATKLALQNPPLAGKVAISTEVTASRDYQRIDFSALAVELHAEGEGLPEGGVDLKMVQEGEALTLKPLEIRLDESTVSGFVSIPSFEGPVVRARLQVDNIDLDRYLPPTKEEKQTAATGSGADGSAEQPERIDFAPLRKLDADAIIEVGRLKVNGLEMEKVTLTLKAKKGVISLDPIGALLYQGKLGASARLDVRADEPAVRVKTRLSGIQIGPLLAALSSKDYLTGTGNLKLKVNTRGTADQAIRRNLNGDFSLDFRDGAYKGFNLAHAIRAAWAAIKGRTIPDEPKETDFARLRGSGVIRKGVVTNRDFYLASPILRVKGKGKVDLVREKVDYLLTAKVVGSLEGQGGEVHRGTQRYPHPRAHTGRPGQPLTHDRRGSLGEGAGGSEARGEERRAAGKSGQQDREEAGSGPVKRISWAVIPTGLATASLP